MPLGVGITGAVVAVLAAAAVANPVYGLHIDPVLKLLIYLAAAVAAFVIVYAIWRLATED